MPCIPGAREEKESLSLINKTIRAFIPALLLVLPKHASFHALAKAILTTFITHFA
jgi:hypothetical protein